MAQALQVTLASGSEQIIPVPDSGLNIDAKAGAKYKLIDQLDPAQRQDAIIKKVGNDLIIDMLAGDGDVVITDYFFICELDYRGCAIELETIGGAPGELLKPESDTATQLSDGSALLWTTPPMAPALATGTTEPAPAEQSDNEGDSEGGSGFSWTMAAAGLGGVALLAAAAGGGGGGGDDSAVGSDGDGTGALAARTAAIDGATSNAEAGDGAGLIDGPGADIAPGALINDALTNDTTPTLSGSLDQALAVGESLAVFRNGVQVGVADTTGAGWTYTDSDVPEGTQSYTVRLVNEAGEQSAMSDAFVLHVDGTAPDAPVIAQVAGDNSISAAEVAAGVTVTGTAEAGSVVVASWGDETASGQADANGSYSLVFDAGVIPTGDLTEVNVSATDSFGNSSALGTQDVALGFSTDTVAPSRPTISAVDNTGNNVTFYSALNGVQIHGKAEAGAEIRVTWGNTTVVGTVDSQGDYQVVFDLVPVEDGQSTVTVVAVDAAGNVSTARTETVSVDVADFQRDVLDEPTVLEAQASDAGANESQLVLSAADLLESTDSADLFADSDASVATVNAASGNSSAAASFDTTSLLNLGLQSAENPLL